MPTRTITFIIADRQGRPSIRTTDQSYAMFMEAQGWMVCDVIES